MEPSQIPDGTRDGGGIWRGGKWHPDWLPQYKIRIIGPGLDAAYILSDAEDIEIVAKIMQKIAKGFGNQESTIDRDTHEKNSVQVREEKAIDTSGKTP